MNETTINQPFNGLFNSFFIQQFSQLNSQIETIKDKAARLTLSLFNSTHFNLGLDQTKCCINFALTDEKACRRGLIVIWSYLIAAEEKIDYQEDPSTKYFIHQINQLAERVFNHLTKENQELLDLKQIEKELNDFGRDYSLTVLKTALPFGSQYFSNLSGFLEKDILSGNLIVRCSKELTKQLLGVYQSEIEHYLSERGIHQLTLSDQHGFIAIHAEEAIPENIYLSLLNQQIRFWFEEASVTLTREDQRYCLKAFISVQSTDILSIRQELGLGIREGIQPFSYTFGVVQCNYVPLSDEELVKKLYSSHQFKSWMPLIKKI